MPESPLADKLKIRAGSTLLFLNAPSSILEMLTKLPDGCQIETDPRKLKRLGFILLFSVTRKELSAALKGLMPLADENSVVWIGYPKKSSDRFADLSRDTLWDVLGQTGYRPVSQVALDETWTAIRIRPGSQVKGKTRANVPGIDLEKREVTPPEDLIAALNKKGLAEKFRTLSFTHQKEHVEAIVTAKKPETRSRRIEKTLEMLNKKP